MMMSPKNRSSLSSYENSDPRRSLSRSMSTSLLLASTTIKNIGSLDELGNFKLDPVLQSSLEIEKLSYWEKLKQEFVMRSEREVMSEAKKIINEVLAEVAVNSPKNNNRGEKKFFGQ